MSFSIECHNQSVLDNIIAYVNSLPKQDVSIVETKDEIYTPTQAGEISKRNAELTSGKVKPISKEECFAGLL